MSDLGFIDPAAATSLSVPSGPIRLLVGIPGAKGFGEQHITTNTSRMKQLAGLGYPTAMSFVRDVAANWTKAVRAEQDRLILIYTSRTYDLRIVVQRTSGAEPFWSVVTGIPSRVCREPIAYTKPAPQPSVAGPIAGDEDASETGATVE